MKPPLQLSSRISVQKLFKLWAQNDSMREKSRYDLRAELELELITERKLLHEGIQSVDRKHQFPYLEFYEKIRRSLNPKMDVLEIGSGTGKHSGVLVESGARITLLDLSDKSLSVCRARFGSVVTTICASMDDIPVPDNSFDFVIANGALSYANFEKTVSEIIRVIKPGGSVILLDSLNHNPIYRLNRFIHFLRGDRSWSTLTRMPTIGNVKYLQKFFKTSEFKSFGAFLWLLPFIGFLLPDSKARKILPKLEMSNSTSKYGFKFLFVGSSLIKSKDYK